MTRKLMRTLGAAVGLMLLVTAASYARVPPASLATTRRHSLAPSGPAVKTSPGLAWPGRPKLRPGKIAELFLCNRRGEDEKHQKYAGEPIHCFSSSSFLWAASSAFNVPRSIFPSA
jgi:hypothetical protein